MSETIRVTPTGSLDVLSKAEVERLREAGHGGLHDLFRRCALAVVNSGTLSDDTRAIVEAFADFDIRVIQQDRGIKLEVTNAPASAFVDGEMIQGIRELLFAVLRDVVYVSTEIQGSERYDLTSSEGVTNAVFAILRNAQLLRPYVDPKLVVCWGGHAISREEYDYTKLVGYELGLRGADICTGCGPGAMKGPMKGAALAHAKQRIRNARYIGISEPGIIAAESPNPIVNRLVIMPDIEKRLEAFLRLGHGIVVFPGGVGTAEELLFLLGVLLHPDNASMPFPLVLTGPPESAEYFSQIDDFLVATLGERVRELYHIVVDDPVAVARHLVEGLAEVREFRRKAKDAFFFNWALRVDREFQVPFVPTHDAMASLPIHRDQELHTLAGALRRAFSGIVAGNVKEDGIRAIEVHGKFQIHGEPELMEKLDALLAAFVDQRRMRLPGYDYEPVYEVIASSERAA